MAYHKTLLYLGAFFILFDIAIQFPNSSISIFGILLVLIGYFKWKIYWLIMKIIWIGIFIEVIYDISRLCYWGFSRIRNGEPEKEEPEKDSKESDD
jgi:hypothetical protein